MMFQPFDEPIRRPVPRSVEEVVELLYNDLTLRDRVVMARLTEHELDSSVYLALAKTIRKEFGLHSDNDSLLESCRRFMGTAYDRYEDPAMIIVKELWKKVRNSHHLHLVKTRETSAVRG